MQAGKAPLHLAAGGGHWLTVKALCSAGANARARAKARPGPSLKLLPELRRFELTARHLAGSAPLPTPFMCVSTLCVRHCWHPALCCFQTPQAPGGPTPIHYAAASGCSRTCKALIVAGADIHARTNSVAVSGSSMVRVLLHHQEPDPPDTLRHRCPVPPLRYLHRGRWVISTGTADRLSQWVHPSSF